MRRARALPAVDGGRRSSRAGSAQQPSAACRRSAPIAMAHRHLRQGGPRRAPPSRHHPPATHLCAAPPARRVKRCPGVLICATDRSCRAGRTLQGAAGDTRQLRLAMAAAACLGVV